MLLIISGRDEDMNLILLSKVGHAGIQLILSWVSCLDAAFLPADLEPHGL
jgi:hypothetical protein